MSAANELLMAIHARLTGDTDLLGMIGEDGIRDRLVTGRKLPSVLIGDVVSNDYSTSTEGGEEHLFSLEVWIDAGGRRQAQLVAWRLHALLHDAALDLGPYSLVSILHVRTQSRREPKTKLYVAELRFRAVTEPIAGVTA
ncbi:DUF3168 domain-containing protein [Rhizobium grahamii]|uniref:DUF3168 domain-containing protein n=1 Tax=Rhizobium grahamii TaxID=1120045 RepID=A0A5Q0C0W5_9HYPH|nr:MULTISPECIES: DUF3168 domain-containing protein [Rhizobium]QFY59498.1 DUF3168 domain-containing protein [Rhizobium grahamii]QRM47976.1 DUF3168 domain-containing protein [Rhizobium sp. BG6]